MLSVLRILKTAALVIGLVAPLPSLAITINQTLGRIEYPDGYSALMGNKRVGLLLSLKTSDNWKTADIDLVVRSHLVWGYNDIFFDIPGAAAQNGIAASNFRGTGYIDYSDPTLNLLGLFMSGGQNSRMGFTLTSTSPSYSVWDALTGGFNLQHFFAGGELDNQARISLTYPGITSYQIQLGDAAAVPVPPAIGMAITAILSLLGVARAKKRRGVIPV